MMDIQALLKAYKIVKDNEKKQRAYKQLKEKSFTLGMAEELARTALATGQMMEVVLADKTVLKFYPPEDPLTKRRKLLEQDGF